MHTLLSALIVTTAFGASASFGDDAPRPGSPEYIAALNAQLAQDVHAHRSQSYLNGGTATVRVTHIVTPDEENKIRDWLADPELKMADAAGAKDAPVLGSSIGAVPATPSEAAAAPVGGALPPPAAIPTHALQAKPAAPASQAQVPPLPPSKELKVLKPGEDKPPVAAVLNDGTQAVFTSDGRVSIVMPNGRYHTPPDGVLTLRDGTTFTIENGVRVDN